MVPSASTSAHRMTTRRPGLRSRMRWRSFHPSISGSSRAGPAGRGQWGPASLGRALPSHPEQ
jgi:hypothetical protein